MLRLFRRALGRSGLRIAYSQGYNPRPRLWLVLPRPVGVACCEDLLVVESADDCTAQQFAGRLAQHLPRGIEMKRFVELGAGPLPEPLRACYSLALSGQECAAVSQKIPKVLAAEELPVERALKRTGQSRMLNIRPYLKQMSVNGSDLKFGLSCGPSGSAKPSEVLALLGLDDPAKKAGLLRSKAEYAGLERSNKCPEKC